MQTAISWEQRELNKFVSYSSSNLTASNIDEKGKYDLYDANGLIGKANGIPIKSDYITIIKDGAGVGRIRVLPRNTLFIGTMGAIELKNGNLDYVFALLTRFSLSNDFSGSTIPHIYFKDYGKNSYFIPKIEEQNLIGKFFSGIDSLITLHQRKAYFKETQKAEK